MRYDEGEERWRRPDGAALPWRGQCGGEAVSPTLRMSRCRGRGHPGRRCRGGGVGG
jgi:hypothetical protein